MIYRLGLNNHVMHIKIQKYINSMSFTLTWDYCKYFLYLTKLDEFILHHYVLYCVLHVSQGFDLPVIYFRLLPKSTATLTFPLSSQVCGDTSKTPTSERSSNRRVRPTLKSRRLTSTWPTRGSKLFISCNSCPVFYQV